MMFLSKVAEIWIFCTILWCHVFVNAFPLLSSATFHNIRVVTCKVSKKTLLSQRYFHSFQHRVEKYHRDGLWRRATDHESISPTEQENDQHEELVPSDDVVTATDVLSSSGNLSSKASPEYLTTEQLMAAVGTSPRRIVLSMLTATVVALGGNFVGITSHLLESLPDDVVEATGLDTFYPRGDFKRYTSQEGYTFVYPKDWVADTGLEVAKAQFRSKTLDLTMTKSKSRGILPDAAFGPPGRLNDRGVSSGDTNVSVIVSSVTPGFSLRGTLGDPTTAAEKLLSTSIAPEGSGRTAKLLEALEDVSRGVYQFNYEVNRGDVATPLRAISVIAGKHGDTIITLTAVAPRSDWENLSYRSKLQTVANSFHLLTN